MEHHKVQSVAKCVQTKGPDLDSLILKTMATISEVVGSTLGPGGMPVLIERFEHNLPASVTKDGITVFKSLGFENSTAQCIMECTRDACLRTATDAGDGTTTTAILSEALIRYTKKFCKTHPKVSPQKVVRRLEAVFREVIEPHIRKLAKKVNLETSKGQKMLHAVAKVSANGDLDLADAVMKAFSYTGDEGNVTIVEASGDSAYIVDKINGYMVPSGFHDTCPGYASQFMNDGGKQHTLLNKPVFLLYHGRLTEMGTIQGLLEQVGAAWVEAEERKEFSPNHIVIFATSFSDSILADLAVNFGLQYTIKVLPVILPMSAENDGQLELLHDLSAITGARILDPMTAPAQKASLADLGPGTAAFECTRMRSTIYGYADEGLLGIRIDELNERLKTPDSKLHATYLKERKAKLAGGIARLTVRGSSFGELREKKDRADDAVCAVRGAIQNGVLPGGGWTLLSITCVLPNDDVCNEILNPALTTPFGRLMTNCGINNPEEQNAVFLPVMGAINDNSPPVVYDFLEQKHVDPYKGGLLDSVPAVLEAIRTSISVSSQVGTLAGIVTFPRDKELERKEASEEAKFQRDSHINPADERP